MMITKMFIGLTIGGVVTVSTLYGTGAMDDVLNSSEAVVDNHNEASMERQSDYDRVLAYLEDGVIDRHEADDLIENVSTPVEKIPEPLDTWLVTYYRDGRIEKTSITITKERLPEYLINSWFQYIYSIERVEGT